MTFHTQNCCGIWFTVRNHQLLTIVVMVWQLRTQGVLFTPGLDCGVFFSKHHRIGIKERTNDNSVSVETGQGVIISTKVFHCHLLGCLLMGGCLNTPAGRRLEFWCSYVHHMQNYCLLPFCQETFSESCFIVNSVVVLWSVSCVF